MNRKVYEENDATEKKLAERLAELRKEKGVDAGQSCGQSGNKRRMLSALRKGTEGAAAGYNRCGRKAVRRKCRLSSGDRAILT